jgi:hypothetical protein
VSVGEIPITGSFKRRSPPGESFGNLPMGWLALSHKWLDGKENRRLSRGRWHRVECPSTKKVIHRSLRFHPNLKGPAEQPAEIWIDWDGWLVLSGRSPDEEQELDLRISAARWWEWARLHETHPDPSYRLAARIAWILGILSIALGSWSVVLTLLSR